MADKTLTPEQKKAIETDGSLIVSAAAGSGKTFVLVERIINKLLREDNPVSVDRLLIVTFTRAAANEMRQRLGVALEKKIAEDPTNVFLQRQQAMLPLAEICTMDQYFNSLVKDNFHRLKITPDFRMLDESEADMLSDEALDEVIEEAYEGERELFDRLLKVLGCEKDDKTLSQSIKKLNKYANSYPYPEKWLEEISQSYTQEKKPQDTVFGEILLEKAVRYSSYAIKQLNYGIDLVRDIPELDKLLPLLSEEEVQAQSIKDAAEKKAWHELYTLSRTLKFARYPSSFPKDTDGMYERIYAKALRDSAKDIITDVASCICADENDFINDIAEFSVVVPELIKIIMAYRERYAQKKAEINALCFDDVTHLALNLLVENGEYTDIARELREKYDEILIDEYQDTNSTQDTIFSALSKDETNLFVVGDVKQSIYGFRLAMPEIFLNRIKKQKQSTDPKKIFVNLDKNFRSRKEVLEGSNYIFRKLMNEHTGNIIYDEKESLKAGATYPETDIPKVEMYVLDKEKIGKKETSEIDFVADKIEELLSSGEVYDPDSKSMRRAEKKDICILLRKNKQGPVIVRELRSRGISAYFESDSGFFKNTEVSVILSLLSIIDNPLQDVPLLSSLMSPIFGFTADDIAKLRITDRKGDFYKLIRKSEDEKCKNFVKEYDDYKKLSTVLSVGDLIRTIYERTGYLSVVSAMSNGEMRKLNLMLLTEYAQSYDENGNSGLPGFMRFIERMKKSESDFKPATNVSENANVVRIMSVHKSKGLEFPIVILADTGALLPNNNNELAVNRQTGIGLKFYDRSTYRKYSTIQYEATKYIQSLDDCSESLRALYVAMTRAKERLIITGTVGNLTKAATALSANCFEEKIDSVATEKNSGFLKYLLMGFFRHPNAGKLRNYVGYKGGFDVGVDFKLNFDIVTEPKEQAQEQEHEKIKRTAKPDGETVAEIKRRAEYEYEFVPLADFSTKMSASELNRAQNETEFYITDKPSFAKNGKLTAAEKGTAMHRFMEVCDFKAAKNDIDSECDRLVGNKLLTPEQAQSLDRKTLARFFDGDLYKRIEKSDRVLREQKFTVFLPLDVVSDSEEAVYKQERVLIQGVIDCAFFEDGKLVVLDYKTDRVDNMDELCERYRKQLEVYKTAAEQTFSTEVKELAIYSFCLGEEKII